MSRLFVVLGIGHVEQRHSLLAPLRVLPAADALLLLLCVPVVPDGKVAELVLLRLAVVDVCHSSLLVLNYQVLARRECLIVGVRHVRVQSVLQIGLLGFLEGEGEGWTQCELSEVMCICLCSEYLRISWLIRQAIACYALPVWWTWCLWLWRCLLPFPRYPCPSRPPCRGISLAWPAPSPRTALASHCCYETCSCDPFCTFTCGWNWGKSGFREEHDFVFVEQITQTALFIAH